MRAKCECGIRHRVTSAQCGRSLRCGCGKVVEVPSLRQLRLASAENLIVDKYVDEQFWKSNGCYLCDLSADEPVGLQIELAAPRYAVVATGPERRSVPILRVIATTLFGGLAGAAVRAADTMTQATETVLEHEGVYIEFPLYFCSRCRKQGDLQGNIVNKLKFDPLFLELQEDHPQARVFRFVI